MQVKCAVLNARLDMGGVRERERERIKAGLRSRPVQLEILLHAIGKPGLIGGGKQNCSIQF